MINMYNCDCIGFMNKCKDNQYDLAIIDPPYGISMMDSDNKSRGKLAIAKKYKKINDKKSPDKRYFDELFRISKNQIIWGANHFISKIPYDSSCWIVWDKCNGKNDFADCELAWTSFKTAVRKFKFTWNGMLQENMKYKEKRIHICQKPVALYKWLLQNYAKEGDKIIDTHGGSGSICIACDELGYDLDWMEKDQDYYNDACNRFKEYKQNIKTYNQIDDIIG